MMKRAIGGVSLVVAMVLGMLRAPAGAGPFPTWDDQMNTAARWKTLAEFDGAAFLDKETGLVWAPPFASTVKQPWLLAHANCHNVRLGGRIGWRLPTVEELSSLVDTTRSNPALPAAHPFTGVVSSSVEFYWSATAFGTDAAWGVFFGLSGGVTTDAKSTSHNVWCVRGGQGSFNEE